MTSTDTRPNAVDRIAASVALFIDVDADALTVTASTTDDGYATPGAYTIEYAAPDARDFWPVRFVETADDITRVRESLPAGWFLDPYAEHTLRVSPIVEPAHVNDPAHALATLRTMFGPARRGWSGVVLDVHTVTVPATITVTHVDGTTDTVPAGYYVLTVDPVTGRATADAHATADDMRHHAYTLTGYQV
jgi:hypothetical protein